MDSLEKSLEEERSVLLSHSLYREINDIEKLKVFVSHHVYAVWDFMSLLKALQIRLTSVSLPWQPVGDPETRFLINEIVTGEESDVDGNGVRYSHFELYLKAMEQLGLNVSDVQEFTREFDIENYGSYISGSSLNSGVKAFLEFTFDIAVKAPDHVVAGVFTFGREDIIPEMFINIVRELSTLYPKKLSILKYYLERHIEVDGGEHSHLGKRMVAKLCGEDKTKWEEARVASKRALDMRAKLWDSILEQVNKV